jgi:hypothetical protein
MDAGTDQRSTVTPEREPPGRERGGAVPPCIQPTDAAPSSPSPYMRLAGLIRKHRDDWDIRFSDGMYRAYERRADENGKITFTGVERAAATSARDLDLALARLGGRR